MFTSTSYFCMLFVINVVIALQDDYNLFAVRGCVQESFLNVPEEVTTDLTEKDDHVQHIVHAIAVLNSTNTGTTSKSVLTELNELSQYNGVQYDFVIVGEEGPAHNKIFKVQLKFGNEVYEAEAGSKKAARQLAASDALERTSYKLLPAKSNEEINALNTPTVQLNNIAQKLALRVTYENVDKSSLRHHHGEHGYDKKPRSVLLKLNHTFDDGDVDDQTDTHPFVYKVTVDDRSFYGIGDTAQLAKHEAAKSALDTMKQEALKEHNVCSNEGYEKECQQNKMNLKSPISKVHEIAQKLRLDASFNVVEERGKDHKKTFVMQGKLGHIVVTAEGKSKKEAKKLAAELVLEYVNELPGISQDDYSVILKTKQKKRKRGKKKNKVVQSLKSLGESAVDGLSILWDYLPDLSTKDDIPADQKVEKKSFDSKLTSVKLAPKTDFLFLAQSHGIQIQYKDLGKRDNQYYIRLSLDTKPRYICFGRGVTVEDAHSIAATRGTKLLQKMGFSMKTETPEDVEFSNSMESLDLDWKEVAPPNEEQKM